MKINIGSGRERFEGFLNVDSNPNCNPDYLVNLDDVNIKLPFEDSSIDEVRAYHILEHIGAGFLPLMQEIYRVCKPGALVDIKVPHHHHEVFYGDPTHVRPITVSICHLFDKSRCVKHDGVTVSDSSIPDRWNLDFQVMWYDFEYDPFYHGMIDDFQKRKQEGKVGPEEDWAFQRLMREGLNIAINTLIKLQAIK